MTLDRKNWQPLFSSLIVVSSGCIKIFRLKSVWGEAGRQAGGELSLSSFSFLFQEGAPACPNQGLGYITEVPIGSWDLSLNLSHGLTVQGRCRKSEEPARSHSACLLGSDNVLERVEMPCNSGWCWGQAVFANSLQSPQVSGPWVYLPGGGLRSACCPRLEDPPCRLPPLAAPAGVSLSRVQARLPGLLHGPTPPPHLTPRTPIPVLPSSLPT